MVLDFVKEFHTLIVTPHILTEATNLLDDLKDPRRTSAFALLRGIIEDTEERFEFSRNLAGRELFVRLGLADTAVHAITATGAALLTADLDLYLAAAEVNPDFAINFNHMRTGAW
jgi:hypothetical protein